MLKTLDNFEKNIFSYLPFMKLMAWRVIVILEGLKKQFMYTKKYRIQKINLQYSGEELNDLNDSY